MCKLYMLVLYTFVLCLPENGDLSLKQAEDFMRMGDLWLYKNCVNLLVCAIDDDKHTSNASEV